MHHHPSRLASPDATCTRSENRSPLRALEASFLALTSTAEPLTLPAHLVCEEPEQTVLPVDQVRTRLAHPGTSPVLRERTWCEVVRRAQRLGAPWDTVALAMTVPVLHRMLARLGCPAHLERAELEQEVLAAVATALHTVDASTTGADRKLFTAADRAAHRLVYTEQRRAQRETGPQDAAAEHALSPTLAGETGGIEERDEYTVLACAVQAHVVDIAEARLIARTRLEGEPMQRLAAERGVSGRQLYRHRAAAEQHLAAYLRHQQRED
ncbi:hypothetical protein SAZ_33840 [Streptomyces noursei ZPM]|uniref:Uncharacterized protein n=1 Tax=Streptomyces noursei TaxID=1971 RepID=A0A401RAI1_STRNR|nr:hypothetical protein [Streptomyces noursei]AKA09021.1 hypothetical protein SAZ_33840 [Streptomyces noursei ZPM]EOT03099.1 hypothetical protein K530_15366 [Streptomyces noursei CCRC 11814]EXU87874.1 hypothetical protein P354_33235 [Streptomyces noursei PD-1]UWS75374.1 hypothetical protein N1H47_31555 [Streptomyces noursei]GCB94665.1 hypothetical protein SALB_07466 [Streptomyces noursei]